MLNDALCEELIAMRVEDLRVRQELVDSGELGGSYVPRMEAVLSEPDRVTELRTAVGLEPMQPIPERGPELPLKQQQAIRENQCWWEDWLASKGWRS